MPKSEIRRKAEVIFLRKITDIRVYSRDSRAIAFGTIISSSLLGLFFLASVLCSQAAENADTMQRAFNPNAKTNEIVAAQFDILLDFDETVHRQVEDWARVAKTNELSGDVVQVAILKTRIQQRLDQLDRAYAKFISEHPDHVRARLALASYLREWDRDAEALEQLEKSKSLEPTNPAVWNNLGNYYGHAGTSSNAFICYLKAIELSPKEPLYYQNQARNLYLFQEDAAVFLKTNLPAALIKAQDYYRQALSLSPTNFVIATDLAQTFYAVRVALTNSPEVNHRVVDGLVGQAMEAWKQAEKLAGSKTQLEGVWIHMARIQMNAKRWDEARLILRRVTLPEYEDTRKAMLEKIQHAQTGKPK